MEDGVFAGPVTVLFTDVEGSTELHTRLGDAAARQILRDHEAVVRHHVEQHGGREVKALGDGFMVTFSSTRRALACAVAIQTAMQADAAGRAQEAVQVRMGLNAGEVTEENRDIFGAAVAAAARIAGQAAGGEILVADVVRQLAGKVPGLRFSERGSFSLKGFPEPFLLHEVLWRPRPPSIRLLGPPEVVAGGMTLDLGGTKPRALLAVLALRLNQTVSIDALIEAIWGERAPPSATGTLHSYISRLRKALEDGAPAGALPQLVTRPAGYSLVGDADELDISRFERLVEQARREVRDRPSEATALFRRALALWRGPALGDFADRTFARTETVRLEELRLAVTEELFETELGLGHHGEAVAQLEPLVVAHPLRERLWAQLMVALYRSGRQAEALR
ncbi:MAG: BTAD domain-containing putative transcriptional regulator, partial [Acidimicrobiia bacterium]